MFRVKLVLLSALALLATGSVVSASASASDNYIVCLEPESGKGKYENDECKKEGGSKKWEKEVFEPGESIELGAEGGPSKLATSKFTIECGNDTTEFGHLKGGGRSDMSPIEFQSCKVKGAPKCTVSKYMFYLEGVLVGTVVEEGGGTTTNIEFTLEPGSEATVSGCANEGKYKFKGKQTCGIHNLKEMKMIHEIVCKPAGSEIEGEGGEKGIKFTDTEKVHVVFKPFWGAEA